MSLRRVGQKGESQVRRMRNNVLNPGCHVGDWRINSVEIRGKVDCSQT